MRLFSEGLQEDGRGWGVRGRIKGKMIEKTVLQECHPNIFIYLIASSAARGSYVRYDASHPNVHFQPYNNSRMRIVRRNALRVERLL